MRLGAVFTLSDSEMDNTEVVLVWLKPSDRYIRVWHLVVRHKSTQSKRGNGLVNVLHVGKRFLPCISYELATHNACDRIYLVIINLGYLAMCISYLLIK